MAAANPLFAAIFDMDGVLVDSIRPHFESTKISCDRRGLPLTEETFNGLFGRSFDAFARAIAGDTLTPEQVAQWYWEKEDLYRQLIARNFPAMDGATELLRALAKAGFRLAIGSSGPKENVACIAQNLPGGELFATTVSGDEVKRGKPAPDVFLKAAEKLGVAPARCVVVEDSIHGLRAAKEAGMAGIGLTGTSPREELAPAAALVVDSLRELTPAVFTALLS